MDEIICYKSILDKYCKYIVHMRQQYRTNLQHLGIVLGAGTSVDLGFPNWGQLIERIIETDEMKDINFTCDTRRDAISNAQRLFQSYKAQKLLECNEKDREHNRIEMIIRANWQRIVHRALYKDISSNVDEFVLKEHYLWDFISIIKELSMVINYNFDDTIQRMLAYTRTNEEKEYTRGYTTIWNENVNVYHKNSVIYHPNGFLPHNINEHPSEQLVFLEDAFADQLIGSLNGRYNVLANYFSCNTCLLIGLSLNDPTLKHILRNNSINFPGNYHYYIHHIADEDIIKNEKPIIDANFDVYNLITLFLTSKEIKKLARLLVMEDEKFQNIVEQLGLYNSYKYITVGSVAVGKTTLLSHFRSITTQDEWLEPMPEDMSKDPSKVDSNNINLIDKWVAEQWGKKNFKLLRIRDGIHLIDRGPLDAFAFTPKGEWKNKAELTKTGISPNKASRELCKACILLLIGDPDTMAARALSSHRETDEKKLKKQQELLKYIYTFYKEGTIMLDTKNKNKNQVAKEVARIIFLEDYKEAALNDWLENIISGEFPEPEHLL